MKVGSVIGRMLTSTDKLVDGRTDVNVKIVIQMNFNDLDCILFLQSIGVLFHFCVLGYIFHLLLKACTSYTLL